MNKFLAFFLAATATTAAMADEFTTAGDGLTYTFKSLANLAPETVVAQGNIYTVLQDFTLSEGDTLMLQDGEQLCLADGVSITIDGVMDFRPVTSALVTRASEDALPKGFRVTGDNAEMLVSNVVFEYVAFNHMSYHPIEARNCTFRYANTQLTSTGAIAMLRTTEGNVFSGCRFIQNESSAIGGSATNGTGMLVENCYFYDNNTSNVNKPQLNLISGGNDDIVIRNCTFVGTGRNMVGAIGFMNYYVEGSNRVRIEHNTIQGHRYGIAAYSYCPLNFEFIDNTIIGNHFESNPNNGGSGITLYDYGTQSLNAYAEGNHIEDNLWGVTLLGNIGEINFGKIEDSSAEDYNPGRNVFRHNGFDGVDYDFFNNTSNDATVYAQGNIWSSVAMQDSVSIANVVWDAADQGGHGEVIYTGASDVVVALEAIAQDPKSQGGLRYDALCDELVAVTESRIRVFSMNGVLVKGGKGLSLSLRELPAGTYIAATDQEQVVKFVK